jgi:hypothetical protein
VHGGSRPSQGGSAVAAARKATACYMRRIRSRFLHGYTALEAASNGCTTRVHGAKGAVMCAPRCSSCVRTWRLATGDPEFGVTCSWPSSCTLSCLLPPIRKGRRLQRQRCGNAPARLVRCACAHRGYGIENASRGCRPMRGRGSIGASSGRLAAALRRASRVPLATSRAAPRGGSCVSPLE